MSALPWRARNSADSLFGEVIDDNGNWVARVHRQDGNDATFGDCVRNTNLIAAAPDLLEALERVGCHDVGSCGDLCFVCAAIAKARGGR